MRCIAPGNKGREPRLPLGGSCQPNRLTEGESFGILDAAPNEALVVDQRSLLQSASRPAPSQREPLACTTRFGLPFIKPAKLQFAALLSQTDKHIVIWRYLFGGAKRPWLSLWESWLGALQNALKKTHRSTLKGVGRCAFLR